MDRITYTGKILFEPENVTKKHDAQSSWKKMAFVLIEGEITDYYSWFIKKRYNLPLNKPLRGPHISFINDSIKDMSLDGQRSNEEINNLWEAVKTRWNGKEVQIVLDLSPRSSASHWWLNAPHNMNKTLLEIRKELGLSEPYYKLHMSIGYPNEKNKEHNIYIVNGIINGFIS